MDSGPALSLEHHPPPRPRRLLPTAYDLLRVGFFLFGVPRNGFGSIDVTADCNLRCRHCYFFQRPQPRPLSTAAWLGRLEELRRTNSRREFPFFQCSWVGGEPLLRPDLIERGRHFFRYNTVVTNGTLPLPDWPDVNWYVSVDGDEETHDQLRGKRGTYAQVVRNLRQSRHLRITVAYCITRDNAHCIEAAVRDWAEAGASHITFDFYTPVLGAVDDPMWVPFAERDRILDRLLALRRVYRDFFIVPARTLRLMRSELAAAVTDRCLFARRSFALAVDGSRKQKCVMGPGADCGRCGCVVPFYLHSLCDRRAVLEDTANEMLTSALGTGARIRRLIPRPWHS